MVCAWPAGSRLIVLACNCSGVCTQADMFAETLGMLPRMAAARPAHAVVIARDAYAVGADAQRCSFEVVLTRPAVSICEDALLQVTHASVTLSYLLFVRIRLFDESPERKLYLPVRSHRHTGCSSLFKTAN